MRFIGFKDKRNRPSQVVQEMKVEIHAILASLKHCTTLQYHTSALQYQSLLQPLHQQQTSIVIINGTLSQLYQKLSFGDPPTLHNSSETAFA